MKWHHDEKKCVCEGKNTCRSDRISSGPIRSEICRETQMTPDYVRVLLHVRPSCTYRLFFALADTA